MRPPPAPARLSMSSVSFSFLPVSYKNLSIQRFKTQLRSSAADPHSAHPIPSPDDHVAAMLRLLRRDRQGRSREIRKNVAAHRPEFHVRVQPRTKRDVERSIHGFKRCCRRRILCERHFHRTVHGGNTARAFDVIHLDSPVYIANPEIAGGSSYANLGAIDGAQIELRVARDSDLEVVGEPIKVGSIVVNRVITTVAAERAVNHQFEQSSLAPLGERNFLLGQRQPVRRPRPQYFFDVNFHRSAERGGHLNRSGNVIDHQLMDARVGSMLARAILDILSEHHGRDGKQRHKPPGIAHAAHCSLPRAHLACCRTAESIFSSPASLASSGAASSSFKSTIRSISAICTSGLSCLRMDCTTAARVTGLDPKRCSASTAASRTLTFGSWFMVVSSADRTSVSEGGA